MKRETGLLFGPTAAALFALALVGLPPLIPGYSAIRQTVSEIGEAGSPVHTPFKVMLLAVAICVTLFSLGLRRFALRARLTALPAYLSGATAISVAGVAVFAFPHPLHNLFGLSELIGYQAPLALALGWRRSPAQARLCRFSAVMAAIVWLAILVNLLALFRPPFVWDWMRPVFGLVQRALFLSFFVWLAPVGYWLWQSGHDETGAPAGD